MEEIYLVKVLLQQEDLNCKIDLDDEYFCVPLHKECFVLGPAPGIFTKLLRVPIAIPRRLKIQIIVYLDDMLLMS